VKYQNNNIGAVTLYRKVAQQYFCSVAHGRKRRQRNRRVRGAGRSAKDARECTQGTVGFKCSIASDFATLLPSLPVASAAVCGLQCIAFDRSTICTMGADVSQLSAAAAVSANTRVSGKYARVQRPMVSVTAGRYQASNMVEYS
jgi:hypothetical protein